ncbi:unnamed protein product [Paramecium pentaurelia]|uniref:Uncharacterized protein n=1 Tax=Paramecium pentaurelia TaxID=43138 RepID=A0A8S1SD24_9CILI|nr:unnamed protein product [Paramecium pentaurelia]
MDQKGPTSKQSSSLSQHPQATATSFQNRSPQLIIQIMTRIIDQKHIPKEIRDQLLSKINFYSQTYNLNEDINNVKGQLQQRSYIYNQYKNYSRSPIFQLIWFQIQSKD